MIRKNNKYIIQNLLKEIEARIQKGERKKAIWNDLFDQEIIDCKYPMFARYLQNRDVILQDSKNNNVAKKHDAPAKTATSELVENDSSEVKNDLSNNSDHDSHLERLKKNIKEPVGFKYSTNDD